MKISDDLVRIVRECNSAIDQQQKAYNELEHSNISQAKDFISTAIADTIIAKKIALEAIDAIEKILNRDREGKSK